jgi:hypothetical protein
MYVCVCVCFSGHMIYIGKERSAVTAYLRHYIVVTPRPLYRREGRFVTQLKRLGNTAVLDGVAKSSLPSLRESNTEALVTHRTT